MATVTHLDTTKFNAQLEKLILQLPREVLEKALREEAKQFLTKLLSFLPPKTYSQGRAAVARDIGRTMLALDPQKYRDPKIRAILLSGDIGAIQAILPKLGKDFEGLFVALFRPELHTSRRNRYGHVSASNKPNVIPQPDLVKQYLKTVQDRVGMLKAGYLPAAERLGVTMPNWVKKHGARFGGIEIEVGSPGTRTSITITNRGGKWPDHAKFARDALKSRIKSMETKTLRLTKGLAVNLGFKP